MSQPQRTPTTSSLVRRRGSLTTSKSANASNCASTPIFMGAGATNMPMMWPMNPMFNPYLRHCQVTLPASATTEKSKKREPWDSDSDAGVDVESENEDDFVPVKKHKLAKPAPKRKAESHGEKKGPGRPSKRDIENQKILNSFPAPFKGNCQVAYQETEECRSCKIYKGKVALKPCGHGKYCFKCCNKLRTEAFKLVRPPKCLQEKCYGLVHGWVELYNVSG